MRTLSFAAAMLLSLAVNVSGLEAKPRIALELVMDRGFPAASAQQWVQALGQLGLADVRIRSAQPGDAAKVENVGTAAAPSFHVIGILSVDNSLRVPGGKFSMRDITGLRKWLEELGDQGVAGVTAPRSIFGLLPEQVAQIETDLKQPVDFLTKDMTAAQVVDKLRRRLAYQVLLDTGAVEALGKVKLTEELIGLSSGTSLAVVLRPAGLVIEPQRPSGGQLQYAVAKPREGRSSWPLGWKPEKPNREVLPELFEFINVEISGIPISEALEAVQGRLKVPFLLDHNSLALEGIDLAKFEANVPGKRLTYSLILGKLLSQAKLKYELRVDEAGKPFVWITTIRAGA